MSVVFDIDVGDVERNPEILRWFGKLAGELVREGQTLAAQRIEGGTGAYERSFETELIPGNPPTLRFGNTSPVAIYVEEDTVPHVIRPTPPGRRSFTNPQRPGALRWFDPPGGGQAAARFAPEVHHPGTTGQHIVRDAVTNVAARLLA